MIKIVVLNRSNWRDYSSSLQALESTAEYPFGSDTFRIDHGGSYFSFFERLGEPIFHIALEEERVVGCAAGILRYIPTATGPKKAWYLCDLKIHPEYRNRKIPAQLFRRRLLLNFFSAQRAYAVSMNAEGQENRVAKITKKLPLFPIDIVSSLSFYSFDYEQIEQILPLLRQELGPISFLSLAGKKELIMRSSGNPLKLLHIQHGPKAEPQLSHPQHGFIHMLCTPQDSVLNRKLQCEFSVSASASILGYRVSDIDWSFILTSDI